MKLLSECTSRETMKGKNCPYMAVLTQGSSIAPSLPGTSLSDLPNLMLNNIVFRTVDKSWKNLSCKSQRKMIGFTDFISDKKEGRDEGTDIPVYLHLLA